MEQFVKQWLQNVVIKLQEVAIQLLKESVNLLIVYAKRNNVKMLPTLALQLNLLVTHIWKLVLLLHLEDVKLEQLVLII